MKKTLKLTSLLFTLILAVSVVFTGCGNGRKDSTTKGTTENNNASGTTEDNLVDDAEDAVDDVADGVGDAVDDIANGFDNYDDAHDYLLNRLQNDDKDGKYEVPHMLHHHEGKIINISSIWGDAGASCEVLYSTTKGGINAFTKALAKEVAASNIQVNAIAFGMIDTEMNAEFDEEDLALIKEEIPADYIASPKEAAQMVYHVATSPAYMTGQVITFSGGWY